MEIGDVVKKCRKILIKIKKWPIELMGPVINYISERMKNNYEPMLELRGTLMVNKAETSVKVFVILKAEKWGRFSIVG